jgi:diketogulonate reductase-like aldo/keto reductase
VLRWCIQQKISVIPKTNNPNRARENADIFDFELSNEEMSAIDGLNQNRWYLVTFKPFLGFNPFA